MQRGGAQAIALQGTRETGTAEFAVAKHKGLGDLVLAHELAQGATLVVVGHAVEVLGDGGGGLIGPRNLDGDRVLQVTRCQAFDLR